VVQVGVASIASSGGDDRGGGNGDATVPRQYSLGLQEDGIRRAPVSKGIAKSRRKNREARSPASSEIYAKKDGRACFQRRGAIRKKPLSLLGFLSRLAGPFGRITNLQGQSSLWGGGGWGTCGTNGLLSCALTIPVCKNLEVRLRERCPRCVVLYLYSG